MTLKLLMKLAEPKTFSASLLPVFYGSAFAYALNQRFSLVYFFLLSIGMMLVQGATNMINDYFDFKRSADQTDKSDEKALASGEVTLAQLKRTIQLFVALALAIGVYFAATINWWILAVIGIATAVLFSYSAGPKPICYTPFGEAAAGLTMGMGITTTVIFIQSSVFSPMTVLAALPTVCFISALLLANNLSDWQEDLTAGRKTTVIVLGEEKATALWTVLLLAMLAFTAVLSAIGAYSYWYLAVLLLTFPYRNLNAVRAAKKYRGNKGLMMGMTTKTGLRYHLVLIALLLVLG